MTKNRLTAADIEEIKMKIRQPINTRQKKPEDSRVRLENLTPEQVEKTTEQVTQRNKINNINQPVQQKERFEENETFVAETKRQLKK